VKIKTRRRLPSSDGWRSREARRTHRPRSRRVALGLLVAAALAAGCRHATTTTGVAEQESRPAPEPPAEPASGRPAPGDPGRPAAPPEAPREPAETTPPSPAPGQEDTPAPQAGPAPPEPPPIDLDELVDRLKDTDAIGLFTKLRLKNELDDLTDALEEHFREAGGSPPPPPRLRERYELLVIKVLAVLDDGDPELSHDLYRSRHLLWQKLADPERYTES